MTREELGNIIKLKREEKKLSQQALAVATGLGVATIIRMEQNKSWPNMKALFKVCHYLDLKLEIIK